MDDLSKLEFLTPIQTDDFKEELLFSGKIKVSFEGGYVISSIPKTENGNFGFKIKTIEAKDDRNKKKLMGYLLYRDEYLEARKKFLKG